MHLGILDQMPTPEGASAEVTTARTIEMVQHAEQLGFERYWFAEHHGTKGMVSSSPEIMMTAAASKTERIHVGSGGILLPQYSPYKVAAQMLQLQALFPGRVEAGVGRSPGGGERLRALLADDKPNQMEEYPNKLQQLTSFLHGENKIKATPRTELSPALYSLGLGENSAELAANLGIGYVYGHFINPTRGKEAHQIYKQMSNTPENAKTAIFIVCGSTDTHAEELAISQDIWLLNVEKGLDSRIPSIEKAKRKTLTINDKERIRENRHRMIVGGPDKVKAQLEYFTEAYKNNDWLILTNLHDFDEKKASFRRLAELFL